MPLKNPKTHIFLTIPPGVNPYKPRRTGGGGVPRLFTRDRQAHYQQIKGEYENAIQQLSQSSAQRRANALATATGFYLEFESAANFELIFDRLESERAGIQLLNVREVENASGAIVTYATVFIPSDQYGHFLRKLEAYNTKITPNGEPRNKSLIESIEDIRPALLRSFWTDDLNLLPTQHPRWCELWLRTDAQNIDQEVTSVQRQLEVLGISTTRQIIRFPQRWVTMIQATGNQLIELIASIDSIAELRAAKETAEFWTRLQPFEQVVWVEHLRERMQISPSSRVAICILDTGVNNGHVLLRPVIADEDCLVVNTKWGAFDHEGHGTEMAGLAVFGDLEKVLDGTGPIAVNHRIESVKVLPPRGQNAPELYGAITQDAVFLSEIQNPRRNNRLFCLAVTSPEGQVKGRPSSWSAAIDSLAAGYLDGRQRLLFVSAGNVTVEHKNHDYPGANLITEVEDPAQSWNAITVGAYTEKVVIKDPKIQNYQLLADLGELSPFSSTSRLWGDKHKWPLKPDVLFEGGNVALDGQYSFEHDSLSCLTTFYNPIQRQFSTMHATSAATAKAAWFAAQIWARYPDAWPETVRGLIVHSARWTEGMQQQFQPGNSKSGYRTLIQTCGFGVPSFENALNSYDNSLALIAQQQIRPYREQDGKISSNEMHLYALPWPKQALLDLGDQSVTLRVTLSYFVEPSPGERGWKNRYLYASHGLRFDVNRPTERQKDFLLRINAAIQAEEDGQENPTTDGLPWCIGPNNRHLGSIHTDWLTMPGAVLSTMEHVAIYPVRGWWKERKKEGRWNRSVRYSLIISIETPTEQIDLYTAVQQLIRVSVPVQVG